MNDLITASIVLFNTSRELVNRVISSFQPNQNRRLYLIDNSEIETDYYRVIDNIEYIFNGKNLGYGAAHNIAIKRSIDANAKYHIVLNPDVYFEKSVIDELVKYADGHGDVVYMLPKVVYPNGELQYLCKLLPTPFDLIFRRFFPNIGPFKRINERYILKDSGYDHIMNPPCLSGCFMFLRTECLNTYKLFFDDRFFMYCEDFDLIRRLHRVGKTIYYPYVTIVHDHARESYKDQKMMMIHIKSAILYFNKYGWILDNERKQMNRMV